MLRRIAILLMCAGVSVALMSCACCTKRADVKVVDWDYQMKPKMVKLAAFTVAGMSDFIPEDEPEMYSVLWGKLMMKTGSLQGMVDLNKGYGVTLDYDEDEEIFTYLAGFKIYDPANIPAGLTSVDLPEQKYAIFTTNMAGIGKTYTFIYEEWLPKSAYHRAGGPDFELYDEKFNPDDPASQLYIYIPVD